MNTRLISTIAREIQQDWGPKVNFAAKPYLQAMTQLNDIDDYYGVESSKTIILYFLNNAGTWRGETAKRIKAELKAMIQ
jgi:hypothetical protein